MSPDASIPSIPEDALKAAVENVEQLKQEYIFSTKSFFDQTGLRVEEFTCEAGIAPKEFPRFVAHGVIEITPPLPPGVKLTDEEKKRIPKKRQPIQVMVPAKDLKEAFKLAPELLTAESKNVMAQYEEWLKSQEEAQKNALAQKAVRTKLLGG